MMNDISYANKWMSVAKGEMGVKEVPGEKDNPRIIEYHSATTLKATEDEVAWCQLGDVEILTEDGWFRFDELPKDLRVATVDPKTLKVSLELPENYYENNVDEEIVYIDSRSISSGFDKHHLFYGKNNLSYRASEQNVFIPASELKYLSIPVFSTGGAGYPISDEDLRFLAAFLGDGNYVTYKSGNHSCIRFNVSRPDKIERLRTMGPYKEFLRKKLYGLNKTHATIFYFNFPEYFNDIFTEYKQLKWSFIFSLSKEQIDIFLDEYLNFDGHRGSINKGNVFYTVDPILRDQLMTLVSLAGYICCGIKDDNTQATIKSSKTLYKLHWSINKKNFTLRPKHIENKHYSGKLYGVSVSTGLVVIRTPDGSPFISGNCSSFVNWVFKQAGMKGTGSAAARSWLTWGKELKSPKFGCVCVFKRGTNPSQGHVAFYYGEDNTHIHCLGGNQGDQVKVSFYKKSDLLGLRWPDGVPEI